MKKIKFLLLMLIGISSVSFSQVVKKGGQETATIKTPTVQCQEYQKRQQKVNYMKEDESAFFSLSSY